MTDPYIYPNTDVLINKEGIRDPHDLEQFERLMSLQRQAEGIPPVAFTAVGYRNIHKHLFQDVYEWAGYDRTVDIAKGSSYFCRANFVPAELDKRFTLVQSENLLQGLSPEQFAARAAEHLSELNVIHPFREGNGRTQRAFLEVLGAQAGHPVDLTKIEPVTWHAASVAGFMKADYEPMRQVIFGAIGGGNSPHRRSNGLTDQGTNESFAVRQKRLSNELETKKRHEGNQTRLGAHNTPRPTQTNPAATPEQELRAERLKRLQESAGRQIVARTRENGGAGGRTRSWRP